MNEQPGTPGNGDRTLPPQPQTPPSWGAGWTGQQPAATSDQAAATDRYHRDSERTEGYPETAVHPVAGPPTAQHPAVGHPASGGSQQPGAGQSAAAPHPAYAGHQPFYGEQSAWGDSRNGTGRTAVKDRKRVGLGTFAAGVLAAGLIGGGVATAGYTALDGTSTGGTSQAAPESIVVNNTDNVNAITGAAVTASPSVVTIAVNGGSSSGSGSGIILDTDGHILTNTHVVTLGGQVSDPTVEVKLNDGRVFAATVVGTDPLSDLAVIKIDAPDLKAATLGNSDELNVGDTAIAIGAPLGLSGTVTDGIVSTLNRTISVASSAVPEEQPDTTESDDGEGFNFLPPGGSSGQQTQSQGSIYLNVIQTDAAINQGNSGGALVDVDGRIIGVNVAIASAGSGESTGNIGVGFSIPINYADRIATEIIENGEATHGFLGVSVTAAAGDGSRTESTFSTGALVQSVEPGSPAEDASLQVGDVITKVGTFTISDPQSLTAAVRIQTVGQQVPVEIVRSGQSRTVDVTLAQAPTP
ncbi:PDZ domain-containing protein [Arthrobacter sp. NamB2]|uniref:S1C family serine protease n=1 Tax=Arthrobacter sp. NamB2 TaxID=2576035 RepID=UPI0010C9B9CC|nr:trypsin-like peptidase domain-containing protein [Arthrobacter sp. NamB2]TKV29669.1 PDZ domain-containing protein [Arthrobacter sp. NamB2]